MSNLFANLLDDSDDIIVENVVSVKRPKLEESDETKDAKCLSNSTGVFGQANKSVENVDNGSAENCLLKESSSDTTHSNALKNNASEITRLTNVAEESIVDTSKMSKRERKRYEKLQLKQKYRKEKRQLEKSRRKERRKLAREAGTIENFVPRALRFHKMIDSNCKIRVAIDLAFEKLMRDDDIRKMLSQLNFCYGANHKAANPLQFYIVNLRDKTKTLFESRAGNNRWDAFSMEESLEELWRPEEIVYLSADSPNVLEKLEDTKTYVIGGLVDHNAHKGLCYRTAVAKGFSHARLPIDEFVKLQTRKVLTINHVFEILLHFSASNNWEEAFFSVIPQRKGLEKLSATNKNTCDDIETVEKSQEVD